MKMYRLLGTNLLTSVTTIVISLCFTLYSSRYISVDEFGILRYVMTLIPLVIVAGFPGFDRVVLKAGFDKVEINLLEILKIRFLFSSLFCILIYVVLSISIEEELEHISIFKDVLIIIPFYELFSTYKNNLIGNGFGSKAANVFLISRIASAILFILSLSGVYVLGLDYKYILVSFLLSMTIPQIVAYKNFSSYIKPCREKIITGKELFLSGFTSTTAGALTTLAFSMDKLLVFQLFDAKYLALYSIIIMIPQEVARQVDSFIPYIYMRLLNFNFNLKSNSLILIPAMIIAIIIYTAVFFNTSMFIFGDKYIFRLFDVFLSAVLIFTQSSEFYATQRLYISRGGNSLVCTAAANNVLTFMLIYTIGVSFGIPGLIGSLIIKNISISTFSWWAIIKNGK